MSELVDMPIKINRELFQARRCLLVNDVHYNSDGVTAMNFAGYAVSGHVRVAKLSTSTKLCDVTFANDLENGLIYAYVSAANATLVYAGATETDAAGRKKAYCDIKVTPSGQDAEQWYVITLFLEPVVTS